jgi:predicted  nucleic acid-binding Zn ribbon protein
MTMYLAKITFGNIRGDHDDAIDNVQTYLSALRANGQIVGDYLLKDLTMPIEAYVNVLRLNSLDQQSLAEWGKRAKKKLITHFGNQPQIQLLEKPNEALPSWRSVKSLYLYTNMLDLESPVKSPEFDISFPLYELPISPKTREYLNSWADAYRDHDSIWIRSGALEMAAYKQLADPRSELAEEGREYCKEIEISTGKPTFFYLYRYYGRRSGEDKRPCPLCGRQWNVMNPSAAYKFAAFHFLCDKCRLVSHIGDSDFDERHARIGEYQSRLKKHR